MRRLPFLLFAIVLSVLPASEARASPPSWSWPVAGAHTIVRPYIAPATAYAAGHRGIDIAAEGSVVAPSDGVVHFAGYVVDRPVLSIAHGGEVISSYEPVSTTLHAGEAVTRGEVIGTIQPGHCIQLCLHFGVRVAGDYVSPMLFLGGIPHSVLLPTRRLG
jgi:murein DD-endopeptidase MepM/ murein hydrolase activator NlpD